MGIAFDCCNTYVYEPVPFVLKTIYYLYHFIYVSWSHFKGMRISFCNELIWKIFLHSLGESIGNTHKIFISIVYHS